ncbi:regulator [Streptomyces sp. ActVer]|uniref:helix-turn-helix domain-containing protein n=1 Tax=Streptomyces sp. ActVer TaxID=3014558 RepID=UPI0022B55298|nr:helix-turn-helix domain-containing protein [Streptomyces sp. ActVer]MCZ4513706.1 regulator [Streptomyces sp. ActVer]
MSAAEGFAGLPGGVAVSHLSVYDWPADDGVCGGTPHLHLTCSEAYVVTGGRGAVQTLTTSGYEVTPLAPGTVAWFTPGTIHRLVNEDDLRITVLMQNSGLPEAGDAVLTLPPKYLTDPETYAAATVIPADAPEEEKERFARARRDLALEGYRALREADGPEPLAAFQRAAARPGAAVVALDGKNRLLSDAAAGMLSPGAVAVLERTAAANGSGRDDTGPSESYDPCEPAGTSESYDPSGPARPSEPDDSARSRNGSAAYDLELPDGTGTAHVTPVRHEGAVIGVVAVVEPPADEAVRPHTQQPRVALAGRSVPWRHATAKAAELARSREPLLLTGERGTGKTALARELLRARGDLDPLVVDAAEGPVDETGIWATALASDRALLLRHAERLAQADVAALNSLLDERPDAPLLLTFTPGTPPGPCLQRLLDTLAARSVTLPALRERPDDIRELLPELAPKPVPGRPPLTWTLDALRALERHPWPGNITELAHLVRALAEHRQVAGPVRRTELPDPVREGPATRQLSPMELAERTAILESLRRHGGNKARAAAALGIARATLYRKLRGYSL